VELPSCRGIWTVYYKSYRGQMAEDNEYHAYLIISLENRTMVKPFFFLFYCLMYAPSHGYGDAYSHWLW
jgi:hypothetical protein